MKNNIWYKEFLQLGLKPEEVDWLIQTIKTEDIRNRELILNNFYNQFDLEQFQAMSVPERGTYLKSLDELLEQDKQREKDGFPRRIRLGKFVKPSKGKEGKVIVVPSTTEPKFYHDNSITEDENDLGETGGSGDEQEGEILGEQQAEPEQGEGEGQGAGEGGGEGHDITEEAFDLGKVLTEQFELPNLKDKGKKRSLAKFKYDLTDMKKGFGQLLDKKATMKELIKKNILLGKVQNEAGELNLDELMVTPKDHVYRIMSKEKEFESQALVFLFVIILALCKVTLQKQ